MSIELIFLVVGFILFVGFFGDVFFDKTKIPSILWLMLIGITLGPITGLADASKFEEGATIFTTFALVYLLFEAGLNADLKRFYAAAPQGLRLSIISFILSFAAIFGVGLLLRLGLVPSLILGAILGDLSQAAVIPLLKRIKVEERTRLSLIFDSAFSDVLCILTAVTIVDIAVRETVSVGGVISGFLASFLIAVFLGGLGGLLWARVAASSLMKYGNFYLMTLAVMLILFSLTSFVNANGAIACLVFGLVIGNSKRLSDKQESLELISGEGREFYSEISFFITAFFFVYLGMSISFSEMGSFLVGLLLVVVLFLIKPFSVFLAFSSDMKVRDAVITEVLIAKGLAAAVLIQFTAQQGIDGTAGLVNVALATIFLSNVVTSIFVALVEQKKYSGMYGFLHNKYSRVK